MTAPQRHERSLLRPPAWTLRLASALAGNESAVEETALAMVERDRGLARERLAPAAVLVAIAEAPREPALILTRRHDDLQRHGGQVAFPGGLLEPEDASPEAAALREAEEEIALAPAEVRVLGRLPRYPTSTGFFVTPVVGYVAGLPQFLAAPEEVAEVFLLPLSVLFDPDRWREREVDYGNMRIRHSELPYRERRIWGVTANVLQLLLPPLRAAYIDRT